jgi:DNA-directed RNA polymerase subunit H (RpoH/RPB5)
MANQNSNLTSFIYFSRKNILDLMKKQGYNVDDYYNFSINEVNSMNKNNQLDMILTKQDDESKIYIHYSLLKATIKLDDIVDDLFNTSETLTKKDTLFIIRKDDANETLTNQLIHIWETDEIFIVVENIKRLQFNILNHSLVPNHRVMNEIEVNEIMKKYNITNKKQFPDISRFDPVARIIGLRPGQVCNITRFSKTAIDTNYYRICI